jgi:hypothetical protein
VSWSQQRLQELLGSGLPPAQLDAALGSAEITSLKSCTGEVSVPKSMQDHTGIAL